jgi:lipooligosaccharide transport system permease protein
VKPVTWGETFGNVSWRSLRVWQRNAEVLLETWFLTFLPPLLEPIFYVLAFGFGLGSLIATVVYLGEPMTYLRFMAPGVIAVAIMFWSYFETTYASFVRMYYQKTFDAILATPLLVEDVIAGEWLWGATKSLLAGSIMLVVLTCFGLVQWPEGLWVLPVAFLGGLLFSALGLITTALCPKIDTFNLPIFIVIFPMFLFSGTFFPIDVLPRGAIWVAKALPLTHVSFLVRGACLGKAPPGWLGSLAYLVAITLVSSGAAVLLMKRRLIR